MVGSKQKKRKMEVNGKGGIKGGKRRVKVIN